MKEYVKRLLIFFLGLPLLVAIVLLFDYRSHLVLNIVAIIFSVLGALEMAAMLEKKQMHIPKVSAAILGALFPLLVTMVINLNNGAFDWFLLVMIIVPILILASNVFAPLSAIENYINRVAASCIVVFYPGFFLAWVCLMGQWDGRVILVFVLTPIAVDSVAWATGMLFGKGNRGIIPVSPNKSIAGFIGGIVAAIGVGIGAVYLLPQFFEPRFLPALPSGILLGLLTGIAAILGDLCESAIKRSANFKDSGHIMPGRGGALDSVDSIAMAAPVFVLMYIVLFGAW